MSIVCMCVLLHADVYDEDMLIQEGVMDSFGIHKSSPLRGLDSRLGEGLDYASLSKENLDDISNQNTAPMLSPTLLPQQYILPEPLPDWIYATAIIEVHFNDGSMRRGFANMLKNGLYITSSEVVYSASLIPRRVYVKMQDSSAPEIICVAKLHLMAVDTQSGLALLENIASTDDYCNVVQKSYYHDRIQKRVTIDVFNKTPSINPNQNVLFPYVDKYYSFVPKTMQVGEVEAYYDQASAAYVKYGYQLKRDWYSSFAYGKGIFDTKGNFLGLISLTHHSYLPVLVKKEVVQDFLCSLNEKKVLQDGDIAKSCAALHKRQRFF